MVDIRMPDGRVVRLPEGMSEQQIRELIASKHPQMAGGTMVPAVSGRRTASWRGMSARPADAGRADAGAASVGGAGISLAGFGGRLKAFGAALEDAMPPSAHHSGNFSGNRRENGNALASVLSNPTAAEMFLKKRLQFLP